MRERVIVALLLILITLAVGLSGVLVRLDHLILDAGQRWNSYRVPDDVVIVEIDTDSLERLGRWPWSRAIHAALINALCDAAPAVIGLDIAFVEPSSSVGDDEALARAIADCGKVVLPLVVETSTAAGQVLETPPLPSLLAGAVGLGRVGVHLDEDGIARSIDLREGVGTPAWPSFAEALLGAAAPPVDADRLPEAVASRQGLVSEGRRLVRFAGPPDTFPSISYARVLEGKVPPAYFRGKTVLVGATAVGLGDFLPTPVSAHARPMSGVEVQANIWLSMREGRLIQPLPTAISVVAGVLLSLIPILWLPSLMPLAGLLVSGLWVFAIVLGSALLPIVSLYWLPPAAAVVGSLSAFPLWSWRRLEGVRRHLDLELRQLGAVLPPVGDISGQPAEALPRMSFEQRIAWIQAAREHMRELEDQRNDALAFISHDLRSPLASAVQQLENDPLCDTAKLLPSLRRAQEMAQDFLRLARAEALRPQQMKVLELGAVLHQAADELYALSAQRGQTIERALPEQPVWVLGDFAALERCAINLLHNAVNYAPPDSVIVLALECLPDGIHFSVENTGAALPAGQVEQLFQRFGRGEKGLRRSTSVGLGLYYVRIVAEKHGGSVGVECSNGRVKFQVSLPETRFNPLAPAP